MNLNELIPKLHGMAMTDALSVFYGQQPRSLSEIERMVHEHADYQFCVDNFIIVDAWNGFLELTGGED